MLNNPLIFAAACFGIALVLIGVPLLGKLVHHLHTKGTPAQLGAALLMVIGILTISGAGVGHLIEQQRTAAAAAAPPSLSQQIARLAAERLRAGQIRTRAELVTFVNAAFDAAAADVVSDALGDVPDEFNADAAAAALAGL